MVQTQELTLTIEQINNLINNANLIQKEKAPIIKKRKGSFEKLKSGSYRFIYKLNNKTYRETFKDIKSDTEAVEKLKEWVEKIENNKFEKNSLTVSDWCQTWLDKQVRPNVSGDRTPTKYANFMNNWFLPKFGNRQLKSITMKELSEYFNWLKTQKTKYKTRNENNLLSTDTLLKYYSIIHSMFEVAKLWGKIETNPCPPKKLLNFFVNPDGTPRICKYKNNTVNSKVEEDINYYSKAEYDKVISKLEEDELQIINNNSLTDKQKHFELGRLLAIEIDFKTGLRRSELYGLKKEDFDLENCILTVSRTRQLTKSKGKQPLITKNLTSKRKVSLPKTLIKKIKYFLDFTPDFFEYIFEDFSIDGLSDFWNRWQIKNNFKVIRFHDIRHTHASILFYLGVDIKVISQRLGHKSIATTERVYLVIIVELRQKVSNQIDNL